MDKPIQSIQSALIRDLLSEGDMETIAALLANSLNACIVLDDPNGFNLTISFPSEMRLDERARLSASRDGSMGGVAGLEKRCDYKKVIYAGGKLMGTLTAARFDKDFSEIDVQNLDSASEIIALQLLQNKKIADVELRLKGSFIQDLITMRYTDPDSITNRAHALAYDITSPHRVLVAVLENPSYDAKHSKSDAAVSADYKTELVKVMQNRLDQIVPGMVTQQKDEIVLLVQIAGRHESINVIKKTADELIKSAFTQLGLKLYIGIGSVCNEHSDFSNSFYAAKKALEIGEYMITEGRVRSFEQFSVHALFLSTIKPAELYNYARAKVGVLLDYDKKNETDLLKTLQEFLYLRNNIEKTARTINMSVSGLKYRLRRIEKILGCELQDYKVSFDLQLALVIMQLYGEYHINSLHV